MHFQNTSISSFSYFPVWDASVQSKVLTDNLGLTAYSKVSSCLVCRGCKLDLYLTWSYMCKKINSKYVYISLKKRRHTTGIIVILLCVFISMYPLHPKLQCTYVFIKSVKQKSGSHWKQVFLSMTSAVHTVKYFTLQQIELKCLNFIMVLKWITKYTVYFVSLSN